MSGESSPVLRHVELPAGPGTRITVWAPLGHDLLGAEPLAEGAGFTVNLSGITLDLGGGQWRAVLKSFRTGPDGATLELQVEGRYPDSTPVPTVA